jgi:transposase-like protein
LQVRGTKEGYKLMGNKKRKHSQECKEEIVQRALSGEKILALGKEYNLSPGLINRWKRQYLDGELINNNTDQEVKKLQTQVAKLEQMIGKLTMENYILKKEKEYIRKRKKEGSSIITGSYLNQKKKAAD